MHHTLFEYQAVSYQTLEMDITHPFIQDLDTLNQAYAKELIQVKRHELQTTQYVGMIQTPHGSLSILPKVDRAVDAEQAATRNLITMLCYAYDLPLAAYQDATLQVGRGSWFEVLTRLFAQQLYAQLQQGMERVYVTVEEFSPALKGRWLMAQQLSRHAHVRHAFHVRYDEFLPDTPLNRVLRYAVELLQRISRDRQNQRLLAEIQMLMEAVTLPAHVGTDDLSRINFTRLNERFYPVFQIACLLIEHMIQVLQKGTAPLIAFIFDMNVLFETFVARFLGKHWRAIAGKTHRDFYLQAQMQGSPQLYLAQRSDGVPAFTLIPDLLLRNRLHEVCLVMDTKYKRLNPAVNKLDISQADIYQMLAYAGRLNCSRVLLLYPSNQGQVISQRFFILNSEVQIDVRTINLHQPLDKTELLIRDFQLIFNSYLS